MTDPDQLDRPSLLLAELCRFVRLRWLAGLVVVVGTWSGSLWQGWPQEPTRISAVGIAILAYNLLFWTLLRHPGRIIGRKHLFLLAWGQLLLDLGCLTLLVIWTGGVSSPLLLLFVLHMVFASLLLPPQASYLGAAAATAMVFTGLWLSGQWPADRDAILMTLGWMLTLLLTVYLTEDITRGLREQDTELRRQHRRTRSILETAADGIITIDEDGIITSVNPAAKQIFGYSGSEMLGRNVKMLMPEPHRGEHDTYIANYVRTGEAKVIGLRRELTGRRKDGTTFPLDTAVSEVSLGNQRIFTGIVRDITERKRAEDELEALNKELLRQQQALIQHEKMAAMGQIAAGVAHEISNPLAGMDSLLQLATRHPDRMGPETAEALREQIARISRLVKQMTDFAHPSDSGWETMPLNDLVESAVDIVRFDPRLKRVEIVRELSPDAGSVHVMPRAMQQVLINLIVNALDALANTPEAELVIATKRQETWRVIEVTDNGEGIAPAHLSRVFEPFFTTKPVGQGTGLGLSISYNLIRQHKGRCEVRSVVGQGTTFSVYLPADLRPGALQPGES